jgi:hypothetical protein
VEPLIAGPSAPSEPPSTGAPIGRPPAVKRNPPLWWAITAVAVLVALFAGGTIQHAFDNRNATRDLYRMQLVTTLWRLGQEEQRQLALPAAQRSTAAVGDIVDGINQDTGINGQGTLQVTLGSGSVAPPHQAAFSVTVSSPYGSTTVAEWFVLYPGSTDTGACVLSSTLVGSGRATTDLELGGGEFVQVCLPSWWRGPITPNHPNLGMANIDESGA